MPSMETLRFGNSGSECVAYALRFARAATGRTLVLRFEGCYHGWTDGIHWSAHPILDEAGPAGAPAVVPATTGIPPQIGETLAVAPFNDIATLERIFAERGDEIAAAIIEPIMGNGGGVFPIPGFLERLRELTTAHGSVLVFDEVLTGMRVGPGGAQGLLGVNARPDRAGEGARGGLPGRGGRWPARPHGRHRERPHDARRDVQLECHGLRRRDRGHARRPAGRASTRTCSRAATASPTASSRSPARRASTTPVRPASDRCSSSGSAARRRPTTARARRSSPRARSRRSSPRCSSSA